MVMEGIAPLGTLDPQHVIAQLAKALADPARTFASPSPSWDASGSQRAKAGRGASTQYFQADGESGHSLTRAAIVPEPGSAVSKAAAMFVDGFGWLSRMVLRVNA